MKIYLAGTSVCNPIENIRMQRLFKKGHKLHSYFYSGTEKGFERGWFLMNCRNKVNLFIDSGAYSALTQGVNINIYEYIKFIKKYKNIITTYANLDVIGEVPNEETAKATLENQKIMEAEGLSPLPAFHQGEPYDYLEYYVKNYNYIGLGGMVGTMGAPQRMKWLDTCFGDYICDSNGYPKVRVHGYGVTALQALFRYPWYSVDSTSWVITGRFGGILIPKYRNGKWVYDENSWKVAMSDRSPNTKEAGKHFKTLSPGHEKLVLKYIQEKGHKLGKSKFVKVNQSRRLRKNERWAERKPENKESKRLLEIIKEPGLCNTYQLRDELNIMYFQDLEKSLPKWPWPFKAQRKRIRGFL